MPDVCYEGFVVVQEFDDEGYPKHLYGPFGVSDDVGKWIKVMEGSYPGRVYQAYSLTKVEYV